jgi:MoxR-like ATPase
MGKVQNIYGSVTRSEAMKTIIALSKGDEWGSPLTVLVTGPMGSSKSAMFHDLQRALPTHDGYFHDCTTNEAGDLLMPSVTDKDAEVPKLRFAPAETLGFTNKRPVFIFADELDKAPKAIQNVFNRIAHEGALGNYVLPPGSFMVATSNRTEEGLGDNRQANMRDRTVSIDIKMPDSKEWIENYALGANVHPTVLTTVSEIPDMLADFRDVTKAADNPYIHHPSENREHGTSCRSLANASKALYRLEKDGLSASVIAHVLTGIIGAPAAAEMISIHTLHNELPRYDEVIKSPEKAKIPSKSAAMCLFVYTAIQRAEPKDVASLMKYVQRLPLEQQAMFFFGVIRSPKAAQLTPENGMIDWGRTNSWLTRNDS